MEELKHLTPVSTAPEQTYEIKYCRTMEEVFSALGLLGGDDFFDAAKGRYRDLRVYRGICDASYTTLTSLQRLGAEKDIEMHLLNNFAKYAAMENAEIGNSDWHKMILGQHHGLPTRLLDWTRSPVVALHFATTESNLADMDQRDCAVWCLDIKKLKKTLPENYQKKLGKRNVLTLDEIINEGITLDGYDKAMGSSSMIMLEPPAMDARIANQYSFFSIVPKGVRSVDEILEKLPGCVTKYIIDKNLRWQIRDMLDTMNVNERIIYPGLDGIAKWLSRYYYPRQLTRLEVKKQALEDSVTDAIVIASDTGFVEFGRAGNSVLDCAGFRARADLQRLWDSKSTDIAQAEALECNGKYGLNQQVKQLIAVDVQPYKQSDAGNQLRAAYRNALLCAMEEGCRSVTLHLMGARDNGYEHELAWRIAIEECNRFLKEIEKENKAKGHGRKGYGAFSIAICVISEKEYKKGIEELERQTAKEKAE